MTTGQVTDRPDFLVVDSDTHLSEPWDLWTSRAPEAYKDRLPQVKEIDGECQWVFDGDVVGPAGAICVVDRDLTKHLGAEFLFTKHVDEVAAAASEVGPRLALMDSQGVWAHLVYPNAVGFGAQQLGRLGELSLRNMAVELFNDAMAEMQATSGQRIFPMGILPWWDLDSVLKEIERIKELGLVGVNTIADPQEFDLPDLASPHWTPMFDALEHASLPLNFHIGASATQSSFSRTAPWPSCSPDDALALGSAMLYLGNARVLANFIYGGILERHPQLRLMLVESGVGWLPFFLQALDYQLVETAPETRARLSLKPSEYFRRQCGACFWFENELLVEGINYLGVDNCLFETDFPHPTCLYPSPVQRALAVLEGQSDVFKQKVFGANAARIYNLPLP